jgi:hypothetical protein
MMNINFWKKFNLIDFFLNFFNILKETKIRRKNDTGIH